jgi:hypothetical protein
MTTIPDGTQRRERRGFIHSFGRDRTCAVADCETKLSRYNKAKNCWVHDDEQGRKRVS